VREKKSYSDLSDFVRFAQTKNTFWWEKAGKGGEKREIVGSVPEGRMAESREQKLRAVEKGGRTWKNVERAP